MAVPVSIISYGGGATAFTATPPTFAQVYYGSNYVSDKINYCAPSYVQRIKKRLAAEGSAADPSEENQDRRGALFCRSGTWLELTPSEYDETLVVRGTKTESSKFSIFDFISVAIGLVSIRGVETNNFVCMDPSGKLYATPASNYSTECVFHEEMMENYYNLYSSCAYGNRSAPWYLEIRRSGKPRKGSASQKRRKASHFLVVHYDLSRFKNPTKPNGNDVRNLVVASLYHRPPSHPFFQGPNVQKPTMPTHRISRERQEELKRLRADELRRSRHHQMYRNSLRQHQLNNRNNQQQQQQNSYQQQQHKYQQQRLQRQHFYPPPTTATTRRYSPSPPPPPTPYYHHPHYHQYHHHYTTARPRQPYWPPPSHHAQPPSHVPARAYPY
ncbi:unnamed protein product [Caenorhabditis bovis]|uniref:FGF n=1 Tax=Caenorhabditis bovis TaxID=2654633 RepID=A0A8S1EL57_9PELO|nr:unnamed protein product [Caenorhabditis bovis]